jgi:pimeloyl-ACP methyl ester carboxylesterase
MAQIVLVHGIAQEQRSAAELEDEWIPSLAGGLENAGHRELSDRLRKHGFSARMAFYGNQFLTPDHQGLVSDELTSEQQVIANELALELLENARESPNLADARQARVGLSALDETADAQGKLRVAAVRLAGLLDRVPFFGRGALGAAAAVNRTLAQVTRYLADATVHDYAVRQVSEHLKPDTLAVIGHSLGSVVAYDALRAWETDKRVPLLLTLGSPLGLSAISRRLQPQPPGFPASVRRWVNIAAPDDIVAARRNLLEVFDRCRPPGAVFDPTWVVDNGCKPHQVGFYLTKQSCGNAIAEALRSF